MLGSSANTLADSTANSAVVAAIAPICVDQFQRSAEAANNLTALKKTDAWQQATFVEKGGWAMMPVARRSDSGVPQACADHSQQPEVASSAELNTTDDARRDARRTSLLSTPECKGQLNRD